MQVLQNHDIFQTILTHLVGGLKDALKYNHPHQFVPVLQKSIQQLAEVLPYIRFAPLIRADHGISKEAQDLINALTASPSNGVAAMVNAFVDKRIYDMHSIHGSYKFIQSKLEGLVSILMNFWVNFKSLCYSFLTKIQSLKYSQEKPEFLF